MSEVDLIEQYQQKKDLYREFARVVHDLIFNLAKSKEEGIEMRCQHMSFREKDATKLEEKIERKLKEKKVYSSLEDIEDLAGVRIVFYLENDRKKFIEYLEQEFSIPHDRIENHNKPNGYRATHIIFQLNEDRLNLSEYKKYQGLKCEIQITSSMYHVWSEVEHETIYKPGGEREKMEELGLNELKEHFEKTLAPKIHEISVQFDNAKERYRLIRKGESLFSDHNFASFLSGKDNDQLYEDLELAEHFIFKVPSKIMKMFGMIFEKDEVPAKQISNIGRTAIYGKNHSDLLKKILDIISGTGIRYVDPRTVLSIIISAYEYNPTSSTRTSDLKKDSLAVAEKLAKYNKHAINHPQIGIAPQRLILDEIKSWSIEKQDKNTEIIRIILKQIVYIAVEGFEQTGVDTYSISRGALVPNDSIKKLRRDTLELVFTMYQRADSVKQKLGILEVIERVLDIPDSTDPENYGQIKEMVLSDLTESILPWYQNIVFDTKFNVIASYPIVHEIERQFYFFIINREHYNLPNVDSFISQVKQDTDYQLYRTLTSDHFEYKQQEQKNKQVDEFILQINDETIDTWISKLAIISKDFDILERWQLQRFERLIEGIIMSNGLNVADKLFNAGVEQIIPQRSIWSILQGLRVQGDESKLKKWDEYIVQLIEKKDVQLIIYIFSSLNQHYRGEYNLRDIDLKLLKDIVEKKETFSIVSEEDIKNQILRDQVFRTLCPLLLSQDSAIVNTAEDLIKIEMESYPDYLHMYFDQLWMTLHEKDEMVVKLSDNFKNFLLEYLVEVRQLQYEEEILIATIGKNSIDSIFNLFEQRVRRESNEIKIKEETDDIISSVLTRYSAIPSNIHVDLTNLLVNYDNYVEAMIDLVTRLRDDNVYWYSIISFYRKLHTEKKRDVVLGFARKHTAKDMETAVILTGEIGDNVDLGLCVDVYREIIEHDIDQMEDIISDLQGNMGNIGGVSGYDGFANAFTAKAEEMKTMAEHEENEKVKQFCLDMSYLFNERSVYEKQRAEDEKAVRKIQYESTI